MRLITNNGFDFLQFLLIVKSVFSILLLIYCKLHAHKVAKQAHTLEMHSVNNYDKQALINANAI